MRGDERVVVILLYEEFGQCFLSIESCAARGEEKAREDEVRRTSLDALAALRFRSQHALKHIGASLLDVDEMQRGHGWVGGYRGRRGARLGRF